MSDNLIKWMDHVRDGNYDAARTYLSLRLGDAAARRISEELFAAKVEWRRPNDLLRAADRTPLPLSDPGVHRNLLKVLRGEKLSPVLFVSFDYGGDMADGFHRISLAFHIDPFEHIPVKIARYTK